MPSWLMQVGATQLPGGASYEYGYGPVPLPPGATATRVPGVGWNYDYTQAQQQQRSPELEMIRQKLLGVLPMEIPTKTPEPEKPSASASIVNTILNAGAVASGLGSVYDLGKLIFGGGK